MTGSLNTYESTLLTALRDHVETRSPGSRRPVRRAVAASVAAVTAAIAGLVLLPGLGTNAAYSVAEGNAGEIRVEVSRLEDAAGLERALRSKGVHADVTYLAGGGECVHRLRPVDRGGITTSVGSDHSFRITLAPGVIRDGETLVIDASLRDIPGEATAGPDGVRDEGGVEVWQSVQIAVGDPGPCLPR